MSSEREEQLIVENDQLIDELAEARATIRELRQEIDFLKEVITIIHKFSKIQE